MKEGDKGKGRGWCREGRRVRGGAEQAWEGRGGRAGGGAGREGGEGMEGQLTPSLCESTDSLF